MNTRSRRVPDWLVEKLALGECSPDTARKLKQRLAEEPGGPERLEQLARSSQELLARHPPEEVVPRIRASLVQRERTERARQVRRRTLAIAGPLVALATTLVVVLPASLHRSEEGARSNGAELPEFTRNKGGVRPTLHVHRRRGANLEPVPDGAAVAPGDQLQLSYLAPEASHGMAFSIDGNGQVTLQHPAGGSSSSELERGKHMLPFSYELDDAPGFERFFLVYSASPFQAEPILESARQLAAQPERARTGSLALPPGVSQISITLRKTKP